MSEAIAALVVQARDGRPEALRELAALHLRPCYAVALAILGVPADADDVAQETLIAALGRLEQCRDPAAFAGWLYTAVRNRARNLLASHAVRGRYVADEEAQGAPYVPPPEAADRRERLLAALAALSSIEREVVLLHDLHDCTHAELAVAVGTTELMSRQYLSRARRKLRALLAEDAPEEVRDGP